MPRSQAMLFAHPTSQSIVHSLTPWYVLKSASVFNMFPFDKIIQRTSRPRSCPSRLPRPTPPSAFSLLSVRSMVDMNAQNTAHANKSLGIDAVCIISSYLDPGTTLSSVCAAVGRNDAHIIRHRYLQNNENYLVKTLEALNNTLADKTNNVSTGHNKALAKFYQNLRAFNKCSDNILVWMEVNNNSWQQRCLADKVRSFQYNEITSTFECVDTNCIFNNLAIATMLGLKEVVKYLLDYQDEPASSLSNGYFVPLHISQSTPFLLHEIAVVRGNNEFLELILSSHRYTIDSPSETITAMAKESYIPRVSFDYFLRHSKVNVHALDADFDVPILVKMIWHFDETIRSNTRICSDADGGGIDHLFGRVTSLIQAGADPHMVPQLWRRSSLDSVRNRIENDSEYAVEWKRFVKCLEVSA